MGIKKFSKQQGFVGERKSNRQDNLENPTILPQVRMQLSKNTMLKDKKKCLCDSADSLS